MNRSDVLPNWNGNYTLPVVNGDDVLHDVNGNGLSSPLGKVRMACMRMAWYQWNGSVILPGVDGNYTVTPSVGLQC